MSEFLLALLAVKVAVEAVVVAELFSVAIPVSLLVFCLVMVTTTAVRPWSTMEFCKQTLG